MVTVEFAPALRRHVDCAPQQVPPGLLRDALEQALRAAPALAPYVFDDQRAVRKHVAVFVNRELVADRVRLDRPLWDQPGRREWFGGGYDHAGIHSILVDPRDARHLTLGISCGGVWQTRDAGASWLLTAQGMKADYLPAESADDGNTQDPHAMVQCRANPDALWVQHHCGIYRSTDSGLLWQAIAAPAPSGFGFAVVCDPANPQRAWFVPAQADVCRIPVAGRVVVLRTDDGGQSFQAFGDGLPQNHAYHLVYRHALDVDASGQVLAMGSTTGGLWVSADAGENWQELSRDLPPLSTVRFA